MKFVDSHTGLLRSARSWGVLGLALALAVVGTADPLQSYALNAPGKDTITVSNQIGEFVPGQVIVLFRKDVSEDRIKEINKSQATTVLNVIPDLKIYLLQLPEGVSPPEAARRYRELPEVLAADPNFVVRAATNDVDFPKQWYFENTGNNPGNHPLNLGFIDADIDAPEGWLVSMGASNVKIAILDTGVDNTHPDLSGKVLASANWTTCPTWPLPDVNGHGTHVAGLAAALTNNTTAIAGTCPLCSLLNAKVLGDNGAGCLFDLQAGINWAVNNGANILNASLAGPGLCPTTLQPVINMVQQSNAIFVAAAGNNTLNLNSSPVWPAVCSNVVTVAATDARDDRASFSNYGAPIVDIAAPGVDVLSLQPSALGGGTTRKDGTSMAAPIVSGALGVIWAHFPSFTNTLVINQMLNNADKIDGTVNYPGYLTNINSWQYGRLNLCRALGVKNCDPPNPKPFIISAPDCPPGGGVVTLDLSTGTTEIPSVGINDDPFGTQDSKWRIIQVPSSTHGQLPGFYPIGFYPAFSTASHSQWVPDNPNTQLPGANWIHPLNSPVAELPAGWWLASSKGFYKYRVQFILPAGTYTSLSVGGSFAADDIATLYLNGQQIAVGPGAFNTLTNFSHSVLGDFNIGGVNELVVKVENGQSVTGLLVHATLQATCPCVQAPSGMVAWWPLDELTGATAINDIAPPPSSIFNNVGTPQPGGQVGSPNGPNAVTGQVNGALYFFPGHFVQVSDHSEINFGKFDLSIDAWIKSVQAGLQGIDPIVDKLALPLPLPSPPTGKGYALYIKGQQLHFVMGDGGSLATYISASSIPIQPQTWTHVAVTVARSTKIVTLYINGNQVPLQAAVPSMPAGSITTNVPLVIGHSGLQPDAPVEIAIDELEIFNRALTQPEIQSIFSAGAAGKCKPVPEPTADLGDAPDSTNHVGAAMNAYPSVTARFPTVYDPPTPGPAGPLHLNAKGDAWLGGDVTFEGEADKGWDQDTALGNNIQPPSTANRDDKDDGVILPIILPAVGCGNMQFQYTVTAVGPPKPRYVNVWFDFNQDGDWQDVIPCWGTALVAREWAVQNQTFNVGAGFYTFTTPVFVGFRPTIGPPGMWMRITLTDTPVASTQGADGSGPVGGYKFGETEDYLLDVKPGKAEICVTKFNDLDGDGVQDPGEPGLPNWTFTVTPGGPTILTGSQGTFCFGVPAPATYTISEVLQAGWTPTVPSTGTQTVTVSPSQLVNLSFGNQKKKYDDKKCDLTIGKTGDPPQPISGQQVFFNITMKNVGTGPCGPDTVVQDFRPQGLTFTAAPVANQPGWACSLPGGNASCVTAGTLPPGYTATFTFLATVTAPPGSTITNCATVSNRADTNPANNQSCVTIQVQRGVGPPPRPLDPKGLPLPPRPVDPKGLPLPPPPPRPFDPKGLEGR